VTRPDISTQVRFRKEEEIRKGEAELRATARWAQDNVKILTSCPSCLQGLSRYGNDLNNGLLEADYIVVEMARRSWARTGCPSTWPAPTTAASSGCWCEHRRGLHRTSRLPLVRRPGWRAGLAGATPA
jgi:hypothetical protein